MTRKLPEHAKDFKGRAQNIPDRDTFLLPYQARWVNDQSLIRLMEKSRRIGISYATAYDQVRRHSVEGYGVDTWFSSRDDLTAKEFIIYCQKFAKVLKQAANAFDEDVLLEDGKAATASILRFANHTRINSVASNPDVFAGKGGNVGLDEFALRSDPRAVYDIASPTIDWGGRLSIISTHRGAGNFFNKLISDERSDNKDKHRGISLHRVTLTTALEEGFLWKLQTKLPESDPRMQMDEADYWNYQRSRVSSEERFLQEYECQPEDEDSVYLPYDLIDGSLMIGSNNLVQHTETTVDFRGKKGAIRYLLPAGLAPSELPRYLEKISRKGASIYHGKDVARKGDLSVDWFCEKRDGLMVTLAVIEFDRVQYSRQEDELYPLLPFVRRSCIDNTGLGGQFAERAEQKFSHRVEGHTFSAKFKEELAPPVRSAFEDRSLRVPDDDKCINDFRMIRKETVGDKIRFVAEDADGEGDSHADRFWALALCLLAAKSAARPVRITAPDRSRPVSSLRQSRTGRRSRLAI